MKRINIVTILVSVGFIFAVSACNNSKNNKEATSEEIPVSSQVMFDLSRAKVNWTAYKFNTKAGVGGTFNEVNIVAGGEGNAENFLINGTFSIPVATVNSNNEIRDPKIRAQFFGNIIGDDISGKILSAAEGTGELELKMNDISKTMDYKYTTNDSVLVLNSSISVLDWGAKVALDSLNSVCEALHTGEDGVSKLWPDVDIEVVIPVLSAGKQ